MSTPSGSVCQNLNSDDHFDRSFAFVAMEGKNETKKKEITSTTIRASKKITTSYVRKEEQ